MKSVFVTVLLWTLAFYSFAQGLTSSEFPSINPEKITIVRDQWGVPHIYAETDAEVAYGLAWANAEDDFFTMQELLFSVKGMAGKAMGKDGAARDFFVHALNLQEATRQRLHTFSPEFLRYIDAYCQGLNAFAEAHPNEVRVKKAFPVAVIDVLSGYVFAMAALTGGPGAVKGILDGTFDNQSPTYGSNAFSFNSASTRDGGTMLCINPHQPVTGPFSWYEAHLVSNEGLNIHGALFPGGTSVFLGNNANIGWAHTFNHLDLIDIFELEMHPEKKLHYRFNGTWKKLESRKVKLKVKLKSWLPAITVRKKAYTSVAGPTLVSKNGGYYSIKMPALERVGSSEQWYRMNKAQNFSQFYKAVAMGQTTMFNIVYADRFDTIMYLNNAVMPKRNPEFNYSGVVGLRSDQVLWKDFHPIEDLVQYVNPSCGYVFNTNNLPTNATCESEQLNILDFPLYFGFSKDAGNNNRALRFMDLLSWSGEMTFERMKEIKFDQEFRACTNMYESIEHLLFLDLSHEPRIANLQQHIIDWDGCADQNSIGAGVYLLVFQTIFKTLNYTDVQFKTAIDVPKSVYIEALHQAQTHFDTYFNGHAVPLGELQRHVRADVNLALGGFPDALAANYNQPWRDGRFKPMVADSYTHFVQWTPGDSLPHFETLHPFGASNRPDSPHYTDQMRPYAEQTPKVMTLDQAVIMKNAKRVYSPG